MSPSYKHFDEAHLQSLVSSLGRKLSGNAEEDAVQRPRCGVYVKDPQCHGELRCNVQAR